MGENGRLSTSGHLPWRYQPAHAGRSPYRKNPLPPLGRPPPAGKYRALARTTQRVTFDPIRPALTFVPTHPRGEVPVRASFPGMMVPVAFWVGAVVRRKLPDIGRSTARPLSKSEGMKGVPRTNCRLDRRGPSLGCDRAGATRSPAHGYHPASRPEVRHPRALQPPPSGVEP